MQGGRRGACKAVECWGTNQSGKRTSRHTAPGGGGFCCSARNRNPGVVAQRCTLCSHTSRPTNHKFQFGLLTASKRFPTGFQRVPNVPPRPLRPARCGEPAPSPAARWRTRRLGPLPLPPPLAACDAATAVFQRRRARSQELVLGSLNSHRRRHSCRQRRQSRRHHRCHSTPACELTECGVGITDLAERVVSVYRE